MPAPWKGVNGGGEKVGNSLRGPRRGGDGPFVMHLERVCRLIEMGQRFSVEINPCSDVGSAAPNVVRDLEIRIHAGGAVSLQTIHGAPVMMFDLTLSNYKRVWRCWQNGTPTEAQRRAAPWR